MRWDVTPDDIRIAQQGELWQITQQWPSYPGLYESFQVTYTLLVQEVDSVYVRGDPWAVGTFPDIYALESEVAGYPEYHRSLRGSFAIKPIIESHLVTKPLETTAEIHAPDNLLMVQNGAPFIYQDGKVYVGGTQEDHVALVHEHEDELITPSEWSQLMGREYGVSQSGDDENPYYAWIELVNPVRGRFMSNDIAFWFPQLMDADYLSMVADVVVQLQPYGLSRDPGVSFSGEGRKTPFKKLLGLEQESSLRWEVQSEVLVGDRVMVYCDYGMLQNIGLHDLQYGDKGTVRAVDMFPSYWNHGGVDVKMDRDPVDDDNMLVSFPSDHWQMFLKVIPPEPPVSTASLRWETEPEPEGDLELYAQGLSDEDLVREISQKIQVLREWDEPDATPMPRGLGEQMRPFQARQLEILRDELTKRHLTASLRWEVKPELGTEQWKPPVGAKVRDLGLGRIGIVQGNNVTMSWGDSRFHGGVGIKFERPSVEGGTDYEVWALERCASMLELVQDTTTSLRWDVVPEPTPGPAGITDMSDQDLIDAVVDLENHFNSDQGSISSGDISFYQQVHDERERRGIAEDDPRIMEGIINYE